jgi:hypothetical protein
MYGCAGQSESHVHVADAMYSLVVSPPPCVQPLQDAFGIESLFVTTMQAISGAGYPGVASLDITDNVLPFISGEEDKVSRQTAPQVTIDWLGKVEGLFTHASLPCVCRCSRAHR